MSSVIPGTLRQRLWVVWFYAFIAHASFTSMYCRYLLVGCLFRFRLWFREPSVSAVVSVTAITGLQIRRQFRLRPKPEKKWFRSVSRPLCVDGPGINNPRYYCHDLWSPPVLLRQIRCTCTISTWLKSIMSFYSLEGFTPVVMSNARTELSCAESRYTL